MKDIRLLACLLTLFAAAGAHGITLPVAEDTAGDSRSTLTKAAGVATTLSISATKTGFMRFEAGSLAPGLTAAQVTQARLTLYVSRVIKPGPLQLFPVTSEWSETVARTAPQPQLYTAAGVYASVPASEVRSKGFIVIDVTTLVQSWLDVPSSDFGVALRSTGTGAMLVASKEGPGTGHAATLEIDVAGSITDGSIGSAQLAPNLTLGGETSGTFLGDGAGLTNLTAGNITGQLTGSQLANGAAAANLNTTDSLGLGIGNTEPLARLHLGGGKALAPSQLGVAVEGQRGFNGLHLARGVAVSGSIAVVVAEEGAVSIIDISNPSVPVLKAELRDGVGGFNGLAALWGVAISGNIAIVAGYEDAVSLIDISNPAAPVLRAELRDGVGGFNGLLRAHSVAAAGNLIAVAGRFEDAVSLIDISNPAAPVLRAELRDGVGGFDFLGGPRSVAIDGTLLAIGSSDDDSVTLVDISDPAAPVLRAVLRDGVGGFDFLDGVLNISLSGGLLAIASFNDFTGVTLVDVTDPAAPVLRSVLRDSEFGLFGAFALRIAGDRLFAGSAGTANVSVIDISNPGTPVLVAELRDGADFRFFASQSFALAGDLLLVAGFGLLSIIDLAPRADLITEGRVGIGTTTPGAALDVAGTVRAQRFEGAFDGAGLFTGSVPAGALASGLTLGGTTTGTFAGDGTGLTGVAKLSGNNVFTGTVQAAGFSGGGGPLTLATGGEQPIEFFVNGRRALRLQVGGVPGTATPNIIGGFALNTIAPSYGNVIGGGGQGGAVNSVTAGNHSVVGGGMNNVASNNNTVIGGGANNRASGPGATVAGGDTNVASGDFSTVGGGRDNTASGLSSFAAGKQAKAIHEGAFVWGDSQNVDFSSTANNQFLIRAAGGVGINTATPGGALGIQVPISFDDSTATVSFTGEDFTPAIVLSGGAVPGIIRLRNGMEIWPSSDGVRPGFLDVRNAAGTPTIEARGDTGTVRANFHSSRLSTSFANNGSIINTTTGFITFEPAGAVTLSATTPLVPGTATGQTLVLMGTSNTNTVTILDSGNVRLGANRTLGAHDTLSLIWDGSAWVETAFSNN